MSLREEQCNKVCKILDDVLANRPTERDALIVATRKAFDALSEPHWIPVTERLPEKTGKYLAWAVVSFIPDHVDEPNTIKQIAIASYSTRARTWLGDNVEDVIAWMPLPEPYKGVTDGRD